MRTNTAMNPTATSAYIGPPRLRQSLKANVSCLHLTLNQCFRAHASSASIQAVSSASVRLFLGGNKPSGRSYTSPTPSF